MGYKIVIHVTLITVSLNLTFIDIIDLANDDKKLPQMYCFFAKVKSFWAVLNHQLVVDVITKLIKEKKCTFSLYF